MEVQIDIRKTSLLPGTLQYLSRHTKVSPTAQRRLPAVSCTVCYSHGLTTATEPKLTDSRGSMCWFSVLIGLNIRVRIWGSGKASSV